MTDRRGAALRLRNRYLACLYGLAIISGARAAVPTPNVVRSTDLLVSFLPGLLLSLLLVADARHLGKPLPHAAGWLVLFFWPIAAPAYAIGLRRLRGLGLVFGHAVLLYGLYVGATWTVWRLFVVGAYG